jgi:hypothetical protein
MFIGYQPGGASKMVNMSDNSEMMLDGLKRLNTPSLIGCLQKELERYSQRAST